MKTNGNGTRTAALPYLWVAGELDETAREYLSDCFQAPTDACEGFHVLALPSELETRQIARKILQSGGDARIFNGTNLALTVHSMGKNAVEVLLFESTPYLEWMQTRKDFPISLTEAIELARDAITHIKDEIALNIELDFLRERADVRSSYEWNKKFIDPLRAELRKTQPRQTGDFDELPRLVREYHLVESELGDRLAFNTMTQQVELDGQSLELDRIKLDLAVEHGLHLKSSREDIMDIITKLADKHKYNPVERYLLKVSQEHGNDTSTLDNLAERFLGVSPTIYQTFLRKTLIAAVARAFDPGCKVDTCLILQSKQGKKKSTFFKVLAGAEWFDDSFGEMSDKDERLKLIGAWFVEWAELEAVFRRRERATVKAFITSSEDRVRPPYGRSTKVFKRHSIFVGSTNELEFLSDPSGHRRYWVIPVTQVIDTATLLLQRDQIWAAAVAAYRNGEQWWLTDEETDVAETIAREFQTTDPWQESIEKYLESRDEVTISELLDQVIQLELGRQDRATQLRVADTLRQLGYQKTVRRVAGVQRKLWIRSSDFTPPDATHVTQVTQFFGEKRDSKNNNEGTDNSLTLIKEGYQGYQEYQLEETNGKSTVPASETATLPATLPPPNEQRRVAPTEVMPAYLYPVIGRIEAALWAETPTQQRMQLKQIAKEEGQRYKEALPFLSEEELEQISKLRGEG